MTLHAPAALTESLSSSGMYHRLSRSEVEREIFTTVDIICAPYPQTPNPKPQTLNP